MPTPTPHFDIRQTPDQALPGPPDVEWRQPMPQPEPEPPLGGPSALPDLRGVWEQVRQWLPPDAQPQDYGYWF